MNDVVDSGTRDPSFSIHRNPLRELERLGMDVFVLLGSDPGGTRHRPHTDDEDRTSRPTPVTVASWWRTRGRGPCRVTSRPCTVAYPSSSRSISHTPGPVPRTPLSWDRPVSVSGHQTHRDPGRVGTTRRGWTDCRTTDRGYCSSTGRCWGLHPVPRTPGPTLYSTIPSSVTPKCRTDPSISELVYEW